MVAMETSQAFLLDSALGPFMVGAAGEGGEFPLYPV